MITSSIIRDSPDISYDSILENLTLSRVTAEKLAKLYPTPKDLIAEASPEQLKQIKGIGPATTKTIMAAVRLAKSIYMNTIDKQYVNCPEDVYTFMLPLFAGVKQEQLYTLSCDTRNQILDVTMVYQGTVNSSPLRIAELLRPALRLNAPGIILVHNHPSGDPSPSQEDVHTTKEMVKACKLLDIELLDHIILGQGRFISLKRRELC